MCVYVFFFCDKEFQLQLSNVAYYYVVTRVFNVDLLKDCGAP